MSCNLRERALKLLFTLQGVVQLEGSTSVHSVLNFRGLNWVLLARLLLPGPISMADLLLVPTWANRERPEDLWEQDPRENDFGAFYNDIAFTLVLKLLICNQ
jgi:hypothetical protein